MSPCPTTLLGFVLCLGHTIHMQEGVWPAPSIWAEPSPVVSRGRPVTIVCRGLTEAVFRLEDKDGRPAYKDDKIEYQHSPQRTEARFFFPAMSKDTAGPYRCLYHKRNLWSLRSELLGLKVTDEDVSTVPSGNTWTHSQGSTNPGLPEVYVYILVGVSVACVLCLLLLLLLLVRRQHQKKHGSPHSKGEEQRPQERLSPAVDITEITPDVTIGDELPEKNKEMHSPGPVAGDTREVTYAELDKRALTLRAARAKSPVSLEPTADPSMYATLARR